MLDRITPILLTLNEEPNIARTLDQLRWAQRIIIVDSFSSDRTAEIAASYPGVQVIQRHFDTHAHQWNFALEQATSDWVLVLDADYVVPNALVDELRTLEPPEDITAYQARFTYFVFGRPLRGTLYTPKPVLFRRKAARFVQDGHTQRPEVSGTTRELSTPIIHDDRKPLRAFLHNQERYMSLEAQKIRGSPFGVLSWSGKVRKLVVVAPFAALLLTLFVRGTIFDGWRGCYYALQRMLAELILSLKLIEAAFGVASPPGDHEITHH